MYMRLPLQVGKWAGHASWGNPKQFSHCYHCCFHEYCLKSVIKCHGVSRLRNDQKSKLEDFLMITCDDLTN